jgi:uncharacterized protein YqeY
VRSCRSDDEGIATVEAEGTPLQERLRRALPLAMKARDKVAVSALRSALGAVGNAEAVDPAHAATTTEGPGGLAGTVALGAGEAARRTLSEADIERIIRAEIAERRGAADGYERMGQAGQAERLRAEAEVLEAQLGG